jgi:hypothetical protein
MSIGSVGGGYMAHGMPFGRDNYQGFRNWIQAFIQLAIG